MSTPNCFSSSDCAKEDLERLGDAGLTIRRRDVTFRRIVQLAERLKVPVVITFSRGPGRQDAELDHSNVATGVSRIP